MQQRLVIVCFLVLTTAIRVIGQKPEDVLAYIAAYKELAINEMKRTGLPAAIKLAQGIHETEAGKSDLVKRSNNHFGIKCKASWTGDRVFHDDDATGECFRSYSRPEDSYTDHSDFLKNSQRYAFLFELDPTDYEGWAYGLKKAGYATNIRYSQVLIKLIEQYHLQDYTMIALGKMKENNQLMVSGPGRLSPKTSSSAENMKISPRQEIIVRPTYPSGQFTINNTKVIYVTANTAWLSLAEQFNIPLSRLWDFNDLKIDDDILKQGQLVYLQRKRKVGSAEFHVVQGEENVYDICQSEGIRYENLLEFNHLNGGMQPAAGEKLYLQYAAPARPLLVSEQFNKIPSDKSFAATSLKNSIYPNVSFNTNATIKESEPITHLVAVKETLYSISRKYGIEMEKIMEWNRLQDLNLKVGQELIIYKTN